MSKKAIKRIFIFFLCYLPFQYALVGFIGQLKAEPWPSFVFPGFKNVFVYDGQYAINNFYFEIRHSDADSSVLPLQSFFDDIPISMVSGFMRSNLSEQEHVNTFSNETQCWFEERAELKTGLSTEQIEFVHRRDFMKRRGGELVQDSSRVINRIQILP